MKHWKWIASTGLVAVLGIAIVSAVLTPPDPLSQVLLAGPVMLLYMASVLVAMLVKRGRDRAAEDEGQESDRGPHPPDDAGPGPVE